MRRIVISAALVGVSVVFVRAVAPRVHARMLAACERMFEEMPESFPPKRMLRGIEEIRSNSERALDLLEKREVLATAPADDRKRRAPRAVQAT